MRSPEMSHSPAYYQEQGPFGTHRSIVTPPPAARRSQEQSPIPGHPVGSRPSSLASDASPRTSASRGYRVYHQTQGGSSWPASESRDNDSFPAGSTLGAHKEERVRSSITDRPSLMSGEHSNPSITRVRKRGIPSDDIVTHEGHDALLMLVCIGNITVRCTILTRIDSSASPLFQYTPSAHASMLYSPSYLPSLSHLSASVHSLNTSALQPLSLNYATSSLHLSTSTKD